jgi:glutathione S-transferase
MLELYTHPLSPCAQKVRMVLAEKNLDWQRRHISLADKENLEPWYLKLNPLGVVPTLVDGGRPVIESSIICEYLEDAYPEIRLCPEGLHERADMRFWMKHVDNKLHPSCGAIQWPLIMRDKLMLLDEVEQQAILNKGG